MRGQPADATQHGGVDVLAPEFRGFVSTAWAAPTPVWLLGRRLSRAVARVLGHTSTKMTLGHYITEKQRDSRPGSRW